MKFKGKNLAILLLIALILPLWINMGNLTVNKNTQLINPKQSPLQAPILINGTATGVGAHNWTWAKSQPWCTGSGTLNKPYTIENVTIDCGGTGSGILIENSVNEYFTIINCTIFNSGSNGDDAGIKFVNVSRGMIFNNTCSNNGNDGILLYTDCSNNTIWENIANNNGKGGIFFDTNCFENLILNNTVNQNAVGIRLTNTMSGICHHNNILNNTANQNNVGIFLQQANYNNVSGNTLFNNSRGNGDGIRITYKAFGGKSQHNIIENNLILANTYGIFMWDGDHNIIRNNTITKNSMYGIYFQTEQVGYNCENNLIENNTVNENEVYGIYFNSHCNDNTIINNMINDNKQHGIFMSLSNKNNVTLNTINDNKQYGIFLSTSNENNVTSNTIKRNLCGILLSSSNYNNVSENVLINNGVCIFEQYSHDNIIENNVCLNPTLQAPIWIDGMATGVGAHNWTWAESQPWCTGSGTLNKPYIIQNLTINAFGDYGIEIQNSNVYFVIQNCTISNANEGIYLDTVNNSLIIDNNCSNNEEGIYLEYGDNNNIIHNIINNGLMGIDLYESSNTVIYQNTVNYNNDIGIFAEYECSDNTITQNDVLNCSYGIDIEEECNFNNITSNTVSNSMNYGIYLGNDYDNLILNNVISNNGQYGLTLASETYTTISGNIISNNEFGLSLDESSNNNSIYSNFFLKNQLHAVDNGNGNSWNSTTIGNYWDNHTGPDSSPQDGIVDTPYSYISGSARSIDYLPIAAPRITINFPKGGNRFGNIAPSFNVTITGEFLDTMWYTIDVGLHNYTFTENGMINQSAWDALPNGNVTLTFYVKDIVGNVASVSVTIIKAVPSGLNPGTILLITILSIIGGLAILGVIFGILIKKGIISLDKIKGFSIKKKLSTRAS
ncbi:MAG: NosD domain-containing protein [Candidatus Lokiarchaeota archaeon]